MLLGDHVDYDYVLVCVILELMHDFFYLTIWVYDGYIDDDMVVYTMAKRW